MRAIAIPLLVLTGLTRAATAPLIAEGPEPDAPDALHQYGQLVGHWACSGENHQPDGSWKKTPGKATWSWYWVLGGRAVQDVWKPSPEAPATASMGTNLRTYDAESGTWHVVWTTIANPHMEVYRSAWRNDALHIQAERPASSNWPAHLAHITFHNISDDHFDWKYESSALTDGQNWQEVSRLSCDRVGEDAARDG